METITFRDSNNEPGSISIDSPALIARARHMTDGAFMRKGYEEKMG